MFCDYNDLDFHMEVSNFVSVFVGRGNRQHYTGLRWWGIAMSSALSSRKDVPWTDRTRCTSKGRNTHTKANNTAIIVNWRKWGISNPL